MLKEVNEVLEKRVRPGLKEHGGDIELISIDKGIVRLRLTGSCSGCPGASLTVEGLVKSELVNHIPDIKDIEVQNLVSGELLDFARRILNKGQKA